MRGPRAGCGLALALALTLSAPAPARAQRTGEVVAVHGHVADDLYAAGRDVNVEADLRGDAVLAGARVSVRGAVGGDVLAAAGTVTVAGQVADDVRAAGGEVTVEGKVAGDLLAAGGRVRLSPEGSVAGRARLAGGDVEVRGRVGRTLGIAAGRARIAGTVDGDVEVHADSVEVLPTAVIAGDLTYSSPRAATIDPAARIGGAVTHRPAAWRERAGEATRRVVIASRLLFWLGLATAGLLLVALLPGFAVSAARTIGAHPVRALALGLALLVVTPVAAILIMATGLGLPVGLALFALYPVALLVGILLTVLFVGDAAGRALGRPMTSFGSRAFSMIVAVALLALVAAIPWAGGWLLFLALLAGLGGFALEGYRRYAGRPS